MRSCLETVLESVATGKPKTVPKYYPTSQDADILIRELDKINIPREDYNVTCKKRNTPCYGVLNYKYSNEYEISVNLGPKNELFQFCYNGNKKCLSIYRFDLLRSPNARVGSLSTFRIWGVNMDEAAAEMFNKLLET